MKKQITSLLMLTALLFSLVVPACAEVGATGFADVSAGAWYAEAVAYCLDHDLMSGTTATTFEPNAVASRAMLVTMLYRQAGAPAATQTVTFRDLPADAWYEDAVAWGVTNEVVGGYGNGSWGAGDPVTREQIATILWRSAGSPTPASEARAFADQAAISPYATAGVAWAQQNGIIGSKEKNRFDPQGYATRAEVATMFHRWLQPDAATAPIPAASKDRILVAYFSRTGNTRSVAADIAEATGGDLFEIVPQTPYPTDYNACLEQARRELSDDARPALANQVENMEQYDVIILGFPIWHGNTPMAVRSFLEEYDLEGKTLAPFATSGSSGISGAVAAIRTLCPGAQVTDGLSLTSANLSQAASLTATWLADLELTNVASSQAQESLPDLTILVGDQTFSATLQDNSTTRALAQRLPLVMTMAEMNGNEKYYYLTEDLPSASEQVGQIQAGDLMLYGSDCLVIFYASFPTSYHYTRLGRVDDPHGLAAALGRGNVEVTFRDH